MIDYQRKVDVWLNGILLTEAVPKAVVQYVNEVSPEMDLDTADAPRLIGSTLTRRKRRSKEIKIGIVIGDIYDLEIRAQNADAIMAWVQDGILEVSYRPGQRLRVKAGRLPSLGQVREWTQTIEVSLIAYALPFWEGTAPRQVTLSSADGTAVTGAIHPNGTADYAPCDVTVTNTSESVIHSMTLTAWNRTIIFDDSLELDPGDQIKLYHDDDMIFRITSNGDSMIMCRSAASDDELLVVPGQDNVIGVTADEAVDAVFSVRGVWL